MTLLRLEFAALAFLLISVCAVGNASAQQRPLATQDPEPVGEGQVVFESGVTYGHRTFYPLSGLQGNVWQIPVMGLVVGLGPIADLQITGGPYNRLNITERRPAPLAEVVTAMGESTHAVEDIVVGTKIRFIPEARRRPDVGVRFAVRLPNAKHESGLGQDTTDFSASALVGKTVASVRVVANAGLTIMSEPLDAAKQNDVTTYGFSLSRRVHTRAELVGDVNGRWSTRRGIAPVGTESRGVATVGGRFRFKALQLDAAVLHGLTSLDPDLGVTLGVSVAGRVFSPRTHTVEVRDR